MGGHDAPGPVRRYALAGRVATLDSRNTVIDRGVVYVEAPRIVAVLDAAALPAGIVSSCAGPGPR